MERFSNRVVQDLVAQHWKLSHANFWLRACAGEGTPSLDENSFLLISIGTALSRSSQKNYGPLSKCRRQEVTHQPSYHCESCVHKTLLSHPVGCSLFRDEQTRAALAATCFKLKGLIRIRSAESWLRGKCWIEDLWIVNPWCVLVSSSLRSFASVEKNRCSVWSKRIANLKDQRREL